MHYSQLRKSSSRKNAHPGTPRPQPTGDERPFQPSSSRRDSSRTVARTLEEHPTFNFKRYGRQSNHNQQQRDCGLPKYSSQREAAVEAQVSPTNFGENLPDYLVWVKNEPFDFGILSPLPCPKIGINILRKIAEYCREKPGYFPELTVNQWIHICKYKMQLSIDLGFAYFRVFDVLTRSTSTWTEHNNNNPNHEEDTKHAEIDNTVGGDESRDAKFHKVVKQGHDFNEEFKVDTMQFLLFLYIQNFLRLHKKYFVKSYGDEPWPKAWVDNLMQRTGGAGIGANVPEQQQAEFIMANLPDIIDFLMLLHETNRTGRNIGDYRYKDREGTPKSSDEQSEQQHQRIPVDVIKALSFILGVASTTPNVEFKTLGEILHLSDLRWKLEYSRYSATVDKKCFIQWVMKNLKINPWGPSSVPIPQVPVSVMTGVWDDVECFKQNKIFWNTQSYPKTWFLISGVEKQVLIIDTLEPMSSIKIHRCSNSYIFLPGVYSFILIQKCHGITLNIGVCCKVVKFIDCSDISVSGIGRQFLISDVSHSTFNLLTPSSPIVCGSKNHEIFISPYNTAYPNITAHMKTAGISAKVQRWHRPLEISNDGFPRAFQPPNVLPLAPEKFKIFYFPFKEADGKSVNIISSNSLPISLPGPLPSAYQRRLDYGMEKMEEARKEFMAKLMLSEEVNNLIYQITLQRFKKWLKETGHYDFVLGLRSYQKSLEQERSLPILCSKGHDLSCVSRAVKNFFRVGVSSSAGAPGSSRSTLSVSISNISHKKGQTKRHEKNCSVGEFVMENEEYPRERDLIQTSSGAGGGGDVSKGYGGDFFKSSNNLTVHMKKCSKSAAAGDNEN